MDIVIVLVICFLMLFALFIALRYEKYALREKRHGELEEPLLNGIKRGIGEDFKRFKGRFTS